MKILVADDEALARDYLVSLVRQLGAPYEVQWRQLKPPYPLTG